MPNADAPLLLCAFLAVFALANTLGAVGFFALLERMLRGTHLLYDVEIPPEQRGREILGTAIFGVMFAAAFTALFAAGAITTTGYSLTGAVVTGLGCMITFDVYCCTMAVVICVLIANPRSLLSS